MSQKKVVSQYFKRYDPKPLIIFLEGTLINFTPSVVSSTPDALEVVKGSEKLGETVSRATLMIPLSSSSPAKGEKAKYQEVYVRPYSRTFLQVCIPRFEIYVVSQYPENIIRKIMSQIEPENRIKNIQSVSLESGKITMAALLKILKKTEFPETKVVCISVVCIFI